MNTKLISGFGALIAAVVVTVVAVGPGDGATSPTASPPARAQMSKILHGSSRELFDFKSLGSMVATSQVIVDASVAGVQPGVVNGSGDSEERYTNAILNVKDVLYGSAPAGVLSVEAVTSLAGTPIELDGLAPLKPGDEGIFFLRPAVHPGQWVLTNSQGLYLRTVGGKLKGADKKDPLIDQLSQSSDAKLKDDVKAAKQAVEDGKLKSEPYPAGAPRPPS